MRKYLTAVLVVLALIGCVAAQDIVATSNGVDVRVYPGEAIYTAPSGTTVIETLVDGERFVGEDTNKKNSTSVRYASGEKQYWLFPDPHVMQDYEFHSDGKLKETLYLKERTDIAYHVELNPGEYLQRIDGGYKIVDPEDNESETGYTVIEDPFGWDADGVHISYYYELGEDGHTITIIDPQGHKNDNGDNIAYPVVIDPTFTHRYDLKLLLHGNYETDSATPTQDYRDSSRYMRIGAVAAGTVNSGNTTKLLGNGSYFVGNGNITIPDSPDFTLGENNWSWSFSLYEPIAQYNGTEIGQFQDANNYNRVRIVATSGPIFTAVRGGSTVASCSGGVALKAPGWTNISVIMNGSTCTVYTNGTAYGGTGARTGSLTDLSAPFLISSLTSSFTYSAVNIDEVKIFNGGFAQTINEIDGVEYPLYLNASIGGPNYGYGDDNNTIALMHLNGADGSTLFPDQVANRSWTRSTGSGTIQTNSSKFATAGLFSSGTTATFLTPGSGSSWDFGTQDWTIDYWTKSLTGVPAATTYGAYSTDGSKGYAFSCSKVLCKIESNSSGSFMGDLSVSYSMPDATYNHIAFTRNGTALRIFVNGNRIGEATISAGAKFNSGGGFNFIVGNSTVDEYRVSKGVSRWVANFTPPTYAYEVTQPSFTATPSALANPGSLQFNDTTLDSGWTQNGYYWDFGDNTSSTSRNPSHTYSADGIYTVTLNTLNNNMTAATSKLLPVGAPITDFSCSPLTGTAALQVTCQDLTTNSSPITSRLIDFGDGSTSTATPPWTHVYSTFGSYSVNLTETNSVGSDFEYKRDYIITSTSQNQQQTWYSPKSVLFNVYNSKMDKVVGAFVNVTPDVTTFPAGTDWLVNMYGIKPNVANEMLNGTLAMSGTTKSNGALTFTMLPSIGYIVAVTNPANGIIQTVNVTPIDSYYNIHLIGATTNNTYTDMGYNTSLYITEPDVHNVTMNLAYQDMSGRTTLLEFFVLARVNNTVINYQSATGFGSNVVLMNYTVRNIRPDRYSFYYNGVRQK